MRARVLLGCAVAVIGLAGRARAQKNGSTSLVTVNGEAFDSLRGRPLENATIEMIGGARSTVADSRGRFSFDSVAPGKYTFVAYHAALDSIGFAGLSARAIITDGHDSVRIAVPSFPTLWRLACGDVPAPSDSGFVYGSVRDAATHKAIAGATVNLTWVDISLDSAHQVRQKRWRRQVTSDSTGSYGACGIPTDAAARVQAYSTAGASGLIDLSHDSLRVRRRDLFVGPAESAGRERRGMIVGTVANEAGAPFPGARIVMDEVSEVRSDRNGRFTIRDVPIGTRQLQVLSIGMAPVVMTVDIFAADTSVVAAQVRRMTTLDVVRIIGSAAQRRLIQDLESRRHRGGGYMLDSTQIGGHGTMMSVFTTVPTVQIQRIGNAGRFFVLLPQGNRQCVAALWIDGVQQMTGREADVAYDQLLDIHPDEIAAVEVYPHATTVPMELAGTDPTCGVVALWTKSKLSR
jgi:hypothetical protein